MTHLTGKTMLRLAAAMAALCLSIIVTGCVKAPPSPAPVGVLEIGGFVRPDVSVKLEIAAAHDVLDWQLRSDTWLTIQKQITETAYLEYALVLQEDKTWHLFYADRPTGIITPTSYAEPPAGIITPTNMITPTQVQIHAVQQWQTNAESFFTSGPIFEVASSGPISSTAPSGTRVEWKQGIDQIMANTGFPAPVGNVRPGETAFLLLSDGNLQTPSYTLVALAGVQADGTVKADPPVQGNFGATCKKYCASIGYSAWFCAFCK